MERQKTGFAAMTPEAQRHIASLGGRAAHAQGKAHKWDREAAVAAGRKGGRASQAKRLAAWRRVMDNKIMNALTAAVTDKA